MPSGLNKVIDSLPFELHIPTYRFCGPGTRLAKRINQQGKNPLDQACKEHDIAYHHNKDLDSRHKADLVLASKAWDRVKSKDASFGERLAAIGVSGIMHTKRKLGLGSRRKKRVNKKKKNNLTFREYIKTIGGVLQSSKHNSLDKAAQVAYRTALRHRSKVNKIVKPRIITIPKKTGGILPLLAGLSALGSLIGGASAIASAVKKVKAADDQLSELKRHNQTMEKIAVGKGLYLKPYKAGAALFLQQEKN